MKQLEAKVADAERAAQIRTDGEREALEWLDELERRHSDIRPDSVIAYAMHAATLKAMLAQPRLPEEPPIELLHAMLRAVRGYSTATTVSMAAAYMAAREHLSRPKTKTVWHVSCALVGSNLPYERETDAFAAARDHLAAGRACTITPREVPA